MFILTKLCIIISLLTDSYLHTHYPTPMIDEAMQSIRRLKLPTWGAAIHTMMIS